MKRKTLNQSFADGTEKQPERVEPLVAEQNEVIESTETEKVAEGHVTEQREEGDDELYSLPSYSAEEISAMKRGWKPPEIFNGDPSHFRDAKDWGDGKGRADKDLRLKVEEQRLMLLEQKQQMQRMIDLMERDIGAKTKAEIDKLESFREEAIKKGDLDGVKKIEKVIDEIKPASPKNNVTKETIPPEVVDFIQRNSWTRDTDPLSKAKMAYAMRRENELNSEKSSLSLEEKYRMIEKEISHVFGERRSDVGNVSAAEGRRANIPRSNYPDFTSLPNTVRSIISEGVRRAGLVAGKRGKKSGLTIDGYIKNLVDRGYLDRNGNLIPRR